MKLALFCQQIAYNELQKTMRRILLALLLMVATVGFSQPAIVATMCNYQRNVALVDSLLQVGWQLIGCTETDAQQAYRITVSERITGRTVYDSQKVISTKCQQIVIPALPANNYGYEWRVGVWIKGDQFIGWSPAQTIRVMPKRFQAQWIGAITKCDARIPQGRWSNAVFKKDTFKAKWNAVDTLSAKSILLRKRFSTGKRKVLDAVVYVSGMGHYELAINGQKVGDSEFAPLWSEYNKTTYYNMYDVTRLLRQGDNALCALLGNGFFNVQRGERYSKLQTSFGPPQLFLQLVIDYNDGTQQVVASDNSWKWCLSPITFNSIYGGESYDARLEQSGCSTATFDDSHWQQAITTEGPKGKLTAQTAPPVKIMERYGIKSWAAIPADSLAAASAKTKRQIDPSAFVADMGQNLAGFPEITVSGQRGQKITLVVAEKLTRQGACDQSQSGRQYFLEYTLKGSGKETWHPRFTYYGFRYIQVEGTVLEGQPNPHNLPVLHQLQSCFVYNSAPEGATFNCSNTLLTQTHRLIERAERSNMQAVLTDCPHREKLGWLEQDHLNGPSLLYNYDMRTYIPKVIQDIVDTQQPNGMVPTTAPQYVSFGNLFDDSPEWGSTLVILPFMYYEHYADSTLILRHYDAMRRYVDYLTSRSADGIVSHGLGDWYDFRPNERAGFSKNTPVPLVATAHYIYDLQLITRAARMVNCPQDVTKYGERLQQVVAAFNRHFFHSDSCYYGTNSQTSNALPLFLGIANEHKTAVLQNLLADIQAKGCRLSTGDVGNRYLFQVLAENGKNELLYKMLNHYETPGYGYQIQQGATTLTEQWDPVQGSSLNHFMMGQADEWLFKSVAGIRQQPGTIGMRHLLLQPQLLGDITHIEASTTTVYGKVEVKCWRDTPTDTNYHYQITLPAGCDAVLLKPDGRQVEIRQCTYSSVATAE